VRENFLQAEAGIAPARPAAYVFTPSAIDDTVAPPGKHGAYIAECRYRRGFGRIDLHHRDILRRVTPDQGSGNAGTVSKDYTERGCALHHMIIREDITLLVKDHPAPDSRVDGDVRIGARAIPSATRRRSGTGTASANTTPGGGRLLVDNGNHSRIDLRHDLFRAERATGSGCRLRRRSGSPELVVTPLPPPHHLPPRLVARSCSVLLSPQKIHAALFSCSPTPQRRACLNHRSAS